MLQRGVRKPLLLSFSLYRCVIADVLLYTVSDKCPQSLRYHVCVWPNGGEGSKLKITTDAVPGLATCIIGFKKNTCYRLTYKRKPLQIKYPVIIKYIKHSVF